MLARKRKRRGSCSAAQPDGGIKNTRSPSQDRRKIQELDRLIAATQARVLEQRQKMGGLNASQENNEMIAKQIRTLENRLDKVTGDRLFKCWSRWDFRGKYLNQID